MDQTKTDQKVLENPVLFMVFNRPQTTREVFEAIKCARPQRLYVASDGPRAGVGGEEKLVEEVRKIATAVDWPCEVLTLHRGSNLGCKQAISGAISWFFEHEEQGIILEDDCLPSPSFFRFCDELLDLYASDERIFQISGYNKQQQWKSKDHDYFFSNLGGIWGWASWRRAWAHYDGGMTNLESVASAGFFERALGTKLGRLRKKQLLTAKKQILKGKIDSWAYPWGYSRNINRGLACVPSTSLIANIGFGPGATHTEQGEPDPVIAGALSAPVKINNQVTPDNRYDVKFLRRSYSCSSLRKKLNWK